jgi:hypothetical protein
MRRQMALPSSSGLVPMVAESLRALARSLRRGTIRAVAIVAMLVAYAATSLGTIGTSALGIVGVSGAALVGTATPAEARRRYRRRGRRGYRRRWRRGYYYPYYRRRRRRYRPGIYFRF